MEPLKPAGSARPRRRALLIIPAVGAPLLALAGVLAWRAWSDRARADECRRNLELLGQAAGKYAERNAGVYPRGARALEEMLLASLRHRKFLVCPATGRTYRWTEHVRRPGDPPGALLAWEDPDAAPHGASSGRWRVLYVRGRVAELTAEELRLALAEENRLPPEPYAKPERPRPGLREPPDAPPPGSMPKLPPGTKLPDPPAREGGP